MSLHTYPCPDCGETVNVTAAYRARQRGPCRACVRVRNGWACSTCGSTDPCHPSPCPAGAAGFAVRHQIPYDKPGMVGGLFTDGPVYATRPEAESAADRLNAAHPEHDHYVVEQEEQADD